jgi:hypothetical protein
MLECQVPLPVLGKWFYPTVPPDITSVYNGLVVSLRDFLAVARWGGEEGGSATARLPGSCGL